MSIEEIIYDIKEIKSALEDDVDLDDMWLLYKINTYRATIIPQQYANWPEINPSWLQTLPKFNFEKINPANDPSITESSITIGKASIPSPILLPEDLGIFRVSGSGGIIGFEPTDYDTLVMKAFVREELSRNFGYYSRIGTDLFVWPYIMEGKAIIIAEDPTSIQVLDGSSYRDFVATDPYPIDPATAQMIILQILTIDLKINEQSITDLVNDAQSNLKILKDASKTV